MTFSLPALPLPDDLSDRDLAVLDAAGWARAEGSDDWIDRGGSGRRYAAWRAVEIATRDLADGEALSEAHAQLRAPFPYPGGKRRAAHLVWQALGDVRVYVEPFFGSGAVLLSRPHAPGIETVNDADGLLCNVWRAMALAPSEVARHADFPVSEIDMHARHRELVTRAREVRAHLEADPRWCDPELAGWWIWGASQWIGGGWCADRDNPKRQRPGISHASHGVHAGAVHCDEAQRPNLTSAGTGVQRQMPAAHGLGGSGVCGHRASGLEVWFGVLAERLRRVRIICGDFERVLTRSTLYVEGANAAGVFLDPPYRHDLRAGELYAHDDGEASRRAREWALAHGDDPRLRIVLAGLEGEHDMLESWRCVAWTGPAGLGRRSGNRHRERLWLSPHCLSLEDRQGRLFTAEGSRA